MSDEIRTELDSGKWETVEESKPRLLRMNVPGGWLVTISGGFSYSVSFYPDPEHKWKPRIRGKISVR